MRVGPLVVLLCLLSVSSFGATIHDDEWSPGTLRSTTSSSNSSLVGVYNNGHGMLGQRTVTWIFYTIDGGVVSYQGRQTLKHPWDHPLNVTVRGPIKYAARGHDLYIRDDDGKTQKLELVGKVSMR
jgi:hypothetical protein